MKKIGTSLFIFILILLVGCGRDVEQAKRYSEMKSECDSIIAQANLIIKDQRTIADSLGKIRDDGLAVNIPEYKLLNCNSSAWWEYNDSRNNGWTYIKTIYF